MSEAELIQAMHEQRAPVDLEYTPITAPLPELVRPAEVAALRDEAARLRMINERLAAENMTLSELAADRWRVIAELKGRLADAQLEVTRERNNCAWIGERSKEQAARIAELEPLARITQNGYAGYCRWCGAHEIAPLPFARWLDAMCAVTAVQP